MKPIILAVLMDDISSIKPIKDSSFAMMLEAQKRGWNIYTFDSADMFYGDGKVTANARKTLVKDSDHVFQDFATDYTCPTHSHQLLFK